ncbi:MAG: M28 family peptidase [Planctomycetota bacterium]
MKIASRAALKRLAVFGVGLIVLGIGGYFFMLRMPGKSHTGPLPPVTAKVTLAESLRKDVTTLATDIGERNVERLKAYHRAADFIENELRAAGYAPRRQEFQAAGKTCANIEAEIPGGGRAKEIIIVGAHYDTAVGTPGANDNASGVAGLLALARAFRGKTPARTIRFVAFANEEPPHFWTEEMGSVVYARRCRERGETITGMLALETIGFYTDAPKSQRYPSPLNLIYPSTGNFIAFVGNMKSGKLVRRSIATFRSHTHFPSEGAAVPGIIPGVGWSDHWSFWKEGYPALMVTDTAPFRYPHYHEATDTPEKLDYDRMARVVTGLKTVIEDLAGWSKDSR